MRRPYTRIAAFGRFVGLTMRTHSHIPVDLQASLAETLLKASAAPFAKPYASKDLIVRALDPLRTQE